MPIELQLNQHRDYLLRFARLQLRNDAWAEDAVSDTLLAALAKPQSFENKSQLKTWLVGILKHKVVDILRVQTREARIHFESDGDGNEELDALMFQKDGHFVEIEKLLASGGQGVTYIARWSEQPNSPRVVLKEIIIPIYIEKARLRVAERFERDAKLLKSLDHPKIVKLHDYFIEEHRAFLMLEYIEGTTLQEKVQMQGAMPEAEVLDLAKQMLDILDYLHSCTPPVVHRDFTPDNLMVNEEGEVKLIDFDVALQAEEAVKSKVTIVGKQNFLPPEQFRGHPCPQSDIYALGATLYFLLTAREPEALDSCHPQHITDTVSDHLDAFIARCTEPELRRRFRNIADMRADLEISLEEV